MGKQTDPSKNKYSFVVEEDKVDYRRIVSEAPEDKTFIFVQEKTRNHKVKSSTLLVKSDFLRTPVIKGRVLAGEKIGRNWGKQLTSNGRSYRARSIGGDCLLVGKFTDNIKHQIDALRRDSNPKNTEVSVNYL